MLMMISLNLTISVLFMFLNHPMTMGITLLIQTITITLISGNLTMNFWFSYMLFLIMIGGMLVLFIYMTSIASNEIFSFNKFWLILIFLITFIWLMNIDPYYWINNSLFYESSQSMNLNNFSMNKFFNYPSIMLICMMIIYLFITLIAIVKITNIKYGPLRQIN
uniref:NADH-ubiquinone oxidoreductase chain 6 n=1 Tax=Staphylinidae sp. BMNH 1274241 TaxID=1796568 RepID=A0A126TET0_9COLE|nr:NADH dehydrogenase subunit 6 [Staphylinidae sp. BMNH 1274241]